MCATGDLEMTDAMNTAGAQQSSYSTLAFHFLHVGNLETEKQPTK
jgi:hypothetical protein